MHLLAHNLIRKVMAVAATQAGVRPYQISFQGSQRILTKMLEKLHAESNLDAWCDALVKAMATHQVATVQIVSNLASRSADLNRINSCKSLAQHTKGVAHEPLTSI
jgi:hypothetical protein